MPQTYEKEPNPTQPKRKNTAEKKKKKKKYTDIGDKKTVSPSLDISCARCARSSRFWYMAKVCMHLSPSVITVWKPHVFGVDQNKTPECHNHNAKPIRKNAYRP